MKEKYWIKAGYPCYRCGSNQLFEHLVVGVSWGELKTIYKCLKCEKAGQ